MRLEKKSFISLMISEKHIILLPARITGWKGHNVAIDLVNLTEKIQN